MTCWTLAERTRPDVPLSPAGFARSASVPPLTPAAPQHTKGQRTLITGSALALDKKGA